MGTNLITCESQPALGMVCKLVSLRGVPKFKKSSTLEKSTLPSEKLLFRVSLSIPLAEGNHSYSVVDLLTQPTESFAPNQKIQAFHANTGKEVSIVLKGLTQLNQVCFDGPSGLAQFESNIHKLKERVNTSLKELDPEIFDGKKPALLLLSEGYHGVLAKLNIV